jgi:hypothetical protein
VNYTVCDVDTSNRIKKGKLHKKSGEEKERVWRDKKEQERAMQ